MPCPIRHVVSSSSRIPNAVTDPRDKVDFADPRAAAEAVRGLLEGTLRAAGT